MKIHYDSILFKVPPLSFYGAIVLGRHCFTCYTKETMPQHIVDHEMVHQRQMDEVGVLMFYLIYLKDYLKNLIKHRNHWDAYYSIPFEREAYGNLTSRTEDLHEEHSVQKSQAQPTDEG